MSERLRTAAELGRLERESRVLDRAIIDTTTKLEVVLAIRDTARTRLSGDLAAARQDGREQWLAQRNGKATTATANATEGQGSDAAPPRLILPDEDRSL